MVGVVKREEGRLIDIGREKFTFDWIWLYFYVNKYQ